MPIFSCDDGMLQMGGDAFQRHPLGPFVVFRPRKPCLNAPLYLNAGSERIYESQADQADCPEDVKAEQEQRKPAQEPPYPPMVAAGGPIRSSLWSCWQASTQSWFPFSCPSLFRGRASSRFSSRSWTRTLKIRSSRTSIQAGRSPWRTILRL